MAAVRRYSLIHEVAGVTLVASFARLRALIATFSDPATEYPDTG